MLMLLVVEGAMTIVFGVTCLFFMPDTPAATSFLTPEQKEWALLRMQVDSGGSTTAAAVDGEKLDWHWAKMALLSPQVSHVLPVACSIANELHRRIFAASSGSS
jgi:hypothetical protein